jgi:5'(3')-deoxyribonucleotidase
MPNAREIMLKLNDKYDTYICSIGTLQNIKHKSVWLHRFLPEIKNIILIANEGCKMDKSLIRMDGSGEENNIFVDDNASNLLSQVSTPNLIKYCFADRKTEWNKQWLDMNGRVVKDWADIKSKILLKEKGY